MNRLTPDAISSRAIGYRQTIDYLCRSDFKTNDLKAFEKFVQNFATVTRNYAKRQLQWYRRDAAFLW
jgi:tRNA A37 N6-isopentenylltransferase MiaA